ncbi:MAG: hypothetical protein LBO00_09950 [Zoogloeaceae bacterium]|jgi:hypothetical protein|nr:hypothetical protein [Zoogloeaceae bacterium]
MQLAQERKVSMTGKHTRFLCDASVFVLLSVAISGLLAIMERVCAAFFSAWKFHGYGGSDGISIGTNASLAVLFFCFFGLGACMLVAILSKNQAYKWRYRFAIAASAIYFLNGLLLFLLLSTPLAFLSCR